MGPDASERTIIADSIAPVIDAGLVTQVETDAHVLPEIRLRPSPGHAHGHVNVVIDSAGERAVISGDVLHHPCQIAHPEWSSDLDFDKDSARSARLAFLQEFADTSTIVLGTHFPDPAGGRIVRRDEGYVFETSL